METKVAKRYAKSLINLSNEKGVIDAVNNDMKLFSSVCNENQDLALLLSNPIIRGDKKLSILKQIFGQRVSAMTMAFFEIVIRKYIWKYSCRFRFCIYLLYFHHIKFQPLVL